MDVHTHIKNSWGLVIKKFNKSKCAKDLNKHLIKEDKEMADKEIKNMLNIINHQSNAN